jgi:predicted transposase/invertase (TIGR01784 family)
VTDNPHDALFKATFSQPEHAAGELRTVLPDAMVQQVDWDTLQVEPGSFVDENLTDRHSDLLYSVQVAGRKAFVYVLLEHQSTPDPWMPWRMLTYVVRVWERHRREHPTETTLPAVIPVVLFHGQRPWTGPTGLLELVDLDISTPCCSTPLPRTFPPSRCFSTI